ncbi:MAG: cytochrome P450 [Actinobacteria bacterium]|nr:cytochrome P450 [Actinomycetota bacterium]
MNTRVPSADWVTVEDLERDPHPTLARLRAVGPVVWVPALSGWMITTREDNLAAMRDDVGLTVDDPRFTTGQITGPSMLSTDGAEHARHRTPFARPFRLHALGLDIAAPDDILGWYARIVNAVQQLSAGAELPQDGLDAYADFAGALRIALDAAEGESSLLAAALGDASALSRDELTSNAAVLLFGGIETTEGMIANLLHHLLSTGLFAEVASDPVLLDSAIEESLRMEPAAAVLDRYATANLELAGVAIPRGDLVILSMASANRDEALFADPDRFDPRRANAKLHTTFATGPHVCLGMHLARLEAREAITGLARRLPELQADATRPSQPQGLVFRKPPSIWATWHANGA